MPSHFKVKEYCPLVFRNLRERFGIDDIDYKESLTRYIKKMKIRPSLCKKLVNDACLLYRGLPVPMLNPRQLRVFVYCHFIVCIC